MTASTAFQPGDTPSARLLCVGGDVSELIGIQRQLDSEFDFVIVACSREADAALTTEPPFDVIINDRRMRGAVGSSMIARLREHSPDAERLILASQPDPFTTALAAADARVMRLLIAPCPVPVLREAVSDALLRHRARSLRASAIPRVTPMGGHPCCAYAMVS